MNGRRSRKLRLPAQAAEAAEAAELLSADEEFAYAELEPVPPSPSLTRQSTWDREQTARLSLRSPEPERGTVETSSELRGRRPAAGRGNEEPVREAKPPHRRRSEAEARRQARLRDREVRAVIRQLLDELIASYASDGRGVEIREIAGGYRMATKPECHDAVRALRQEPQAGAQALLPALETLAVIAYKQPVTAPEVNEIRGVDSSGVFGSLLARKLIATAGRKPVIGRPILYKTTREFLLRFGLKDVSELPSMEEFEKMAAIELDEPEPAAGDDSEPEIEPRTGSRIRRGRQRGAGRLARRRPGNAD